MRAARRARVIFIALLAVMLGAVIQGSIGFGFALVAVPTFTLLWPEAVPSALLLIAVPMTITMALREHGAIDFSGLFYSTVGRIVGTVAGAALLAMIQADSLALVVGTMIVLAVVLSLFGAPTEVEWGTGLAAGFASGVMSTAAAIGGAPMALAYQARPGTELRSTLSASFVLGTLMSLAALALTGRVDGGHVILALEMIPAMLAGLFLSRYLNPWLDARWLRPAVLCFAGVAGVLAIAQGLH
ncbi:MAG: sulfite exporter TauE/SafE family protein [Actinomycetota bacterium]|nr:sulfite exporter TauE/SafE family protein [Actinomycetota bacterium]